jgi:hypothetical protein
MGFIDWIIEPNSELRGKYLDEVYIPSIHEATKFLCPYCDAIYDSKQNLASHTRTTHPLGLPILMINGRPARSEEILRQPINQETFDLSNITRINVSIGQSIFRDVTLNQLYHELAEVTDNFAIIRLVNLRGNDQSIAEREYRVIFKIAPACEIEAVEQYFLSRMEELPISLSSAKTFYDESRSLWRHTATGEYADALANYIIGLSIKQSEVGTGHLSFDRFSQKLMNCLGVLTNINTPFAQGVSGIIRFNLNDFQSWPDDAEAFPTLRAAGIFFRNPSKFISEHHHFRRSAIGRLFKCPVDDLSERIINSVLLLLEGRASTSTFQSLLPPLLNWSPLSEYDRQKIHVLMAAMYLEMGMEDQAQLYFRALRSDTNFGTWANDYLKM